MTNATKAAAVKRNNFIKQLAEFLSARVGDKSVMLQIEAGRPSTDPRPRIATEWAQLRTTACINGETTEQTVAVLRQLLTGRKPPKTNNV